MVSHQASLQFQCPVLVASLTLPSSGRMLSTCPSLPLAFPLLFLPVFTLPAAARRVVPGASDDLINVRKKAPKAAVKHVTELPVEPVYEYELPVAPTKEKRSAAAPSAEELKVRKGPRGGLDDRKECFATQFGSRGGGAGTRQGFYSGSRRTTRALASKPMLHTSCLPLSMVFLPLPFTPLIAAAAHPSSSTLTPPAGPGA